MLTVRLPDDLEAEIDRIASTESRTKSDVVKDALKQYVEEHQENRSSYEVGQDLFGKASSCESNRSQTYKKRITEKLLEKHSH